MNIEEILKKFKHKKDLHTYLTTKCEYTYWKLDLLTLIGDYWLPLAKYCRLSFLQSVLSDEKKVLKSSQINVTSKIRKSLQEFAVKNIYDLIKMDTEFCEYLPTDEMDQNRWPDRQFVWGLLVTLRPEWAHNYIQTSQTKREKLRKVDPIEKKVVVVSDRWKRELIAHEFTGSKGKFRLSTQLPQYGKDDSVFQQAYFSSNQQPVTQSNGFGQPSFDQPVNQAMGELSNQLGTMRMNNSSQKSPAKGKAAKKVKSPVKIYLTRKVTANQRQAAMESQQTTPQKDINQVRPQQNANQSSSLEINQQNFQQQTGDFDMKMTRQ